MQITGSSQLSRRQIVMVVLGFVIVLCGMMGFIVTILPSRGDPAEMRRMAIVCGLITALAAVWLVKLIMDALRDRRLGIERGPAQVSGRFNVWFGAIVAAGGIVCSAVTYYSAGIAGGGIWTLYYGMIVWGIIQMLVGWKRISDQRSP